MIPEPAKYHNRQWLRCQVCGQVQFYDYLPYSLSHPIRTTTCGHPIDNCTPISADTALVAITTKLYKEIAWLHSKPHQPPCDSKCEYGRTGKVDGCHCGLAQWEARKP